MSLPPLTTLPATLQGLAARAQTAWPTAVAALGGRCSERFAAWPTARLECLRRVFAASDFVFEQSLRDPLMLLDLADSGELERSLAAGELRAQLQEAVDACGDEDELGRCLRRLRNRQQTRIIWRDVCRLTDLRETCNDLTLLAEACIDLAYGWLYARHCTQYGTPIGARSGLPQHLVVLGMGKLGAHELNLSSDIDLISPSLRAVKPTRLNARWITRSFSSASVSA